MSENGAQPAPERTGYLGLGSNLGDPAAHLRAAVILMAENEIKVEAISSTYLTEPVGEILDQPDFLNAAVRIRTTLPPEELLEACKEIEFDRGRSADAPRHSPRPLDVDLLLLGDLELRPSASPCRTPRWPTAASSSSPCSSSTPTSPSPTAPASPTPSPPSPRANGSSGSARSRATSALGRGAERVEPGGGEDRRGVAGVVGDDPLRELGGGAALDRRAEVGHGHHQADAGGDLEVGGVRLGAADRAGGDQLVDPVEQRGQGARGRPGRWRRRLR